MSRQQKSLSAVRQDPALLKKQKQFDQGFSICHLSQMEFPTIINWNNPFLFKGGWVVFFIFIQILIEHSANKQWRP